MREIKGYHVALMFGLAFGIIVAVNMVLAFSAVRTFPGLEVKNSYIAGQGFNARKAAQEALGWEVAPSYNAGELSLIVETQAGPITPEIVSAEVGRPTQRQDDFIPQFRVRDGVYVADAQLAPGNWSMKLHLRAEDGTDFQQTHSLYVPE